MMMTKKININKIKIMTALTINLSIEYHSLKLRMKFKSKNTKMGELDTKVLTKDNHIKRIVNLQGKINKRYRSKLKKLRMMLII